MHSNDRYIRFRYAGALGCGEPVSPGGEEKEPAYAMAYVRDQKYGKIYSDGEALSRGTLFPALYMPYEGGAR